MLDIIEAITDRGMTAYEFAVFLGYLARVPMDDENPSVDRLEGHVQEGLYLVVEGVRYSLTITAERVAE